MICRTVEIPNRWGSHQLVVFDDKSAHFNGFCKLMEYDAYAGWMVFHCSKCDLWIRFPHTITRLSLVDNVLNQKQIATLIVNNTVDQIGHWFTAIPCDVEAVRRYNKHKSRWLKARMDTNV